MKRIFYFAAMALAACTVISCEEKEDPKDPGTPGGGDDTTPTKLATPNVKAEVGETEVLVSWEAVANAASYEYTVDNGAATAIEATSVTLAVADLGAGNHTVSVTALPAEGSKDYTKSDAGTCSFNIEEEGDDPNPPTGDVSEDLKEWIGTYSATSTQQVEFVNNNGSLGMNLLDGGATFEITIEASEDPNYVYVYGFSKVDSSIPAIATIFTNEDGSLKALGLLADSQPITQDNEGYDMAYYGVCDRSGTLTFVTGLPYTFAFINNGGTITSEAYQGALNEAGTDLFKVVATDLFSSDGQYINIYYSNLPVQIPAGVITLTKSSSNAPAANFNSNMRFMANPSFLMPFSVAK